MKGGDRRVAHESGLDGTEGFVSGLGGTIVVWSKG